jgi:ABC-type nitrate/sulfonate/bicarbonate transport system substrate-binding protein
MPRRFGRGLVVAAVLLAVVSGAALGAGPARTAIGSAIHPAAANHAQHSRAMVNVHFILNWLPNVEFAGLWVAQQKGWWEQAGIHMTYTGWSPAVHPETDVPAKGGNTFGFQSGAAIGIAASKGVPITALYTDTQRSVFGLSVMPKSGISSLGQLKGKRIGYQSHEFYVPATMMSCVGVTESQWKPVEVGFDPTELTQGHVDAYLVFVTNEPIALSLEGIHVHTFDAADHCFHFYDDVMFTTRSLIKSDPSLVKKVTSIVARGFAWAHSHPADAAHITVDKYFPAAKGTSAQQNLTQQVLELRAFTPFSRDSHGKFSGLMNRKYWQDSINILYRYKQITSRPNVSQIFTNKFNPEQM